MDPVYEARQNLIQWIKSGDDIVNKWLENDPSGDKANTINILKRYIETEEQFNEILPELYLYIFDDEHPMPEEKIKKYIALFPPEELKHPESIIINMLFETVSAKVYSETQKKPLYEAERMDALMRELCKIADYDL